MTSSLLRRDNDDVTVLSWLYIYILYHLRTAYTHMYNCSQTTGDLIAKWNDASNCDAMNEI